VSLPAPGGDRPATGDLESRLDKLRSTIDKCSRELPQSRKAGSGPAPKPQDLRQRAQRAAARQARRLEAFRACMGRHGFGPEADRDTERGDLRKAFAECRKRPSET
jgi:hypothetical protein